MNKRINSFATVISLVVIITFVIFLSAPTKVQAQQELSKSTINPGSFLYPLDRIFEKILINFQFSAGAKLKFHKALLEERLAELDNVSNNKLLGEVEKTSNRFAAQAGVLTDYINSTNELEKEKQSIVETFEKYKEYLIPLRDRFDANTSFWRLMQQDIDSLDLYLDKLR